MSTREHQRGRRQPSEGLAQDLRSLMEDHAADPGGEFALDNGSRVAVIGGGPSGSFFSYFTIKMARMMGRDIAITIFEPKDFLSRGPAGCNRCGGVVSELMVQSLAVEGINIPPSVVQRGIDSYQLHTARGDVHIRTPALEKTIASVYRGGGPRDQASQKKDSFDNFLLQAAVREGATHVPRTIDRVRFDGGKPVLYSGNEAMLKADLVVGAFGVNGLKTPVFEGVDFRYTRPVTTRSSIAEIPLEREFISEKFGNSIHLFLLPSKNIKFAAIVPKTSHVALCMIGKKLNGARVKGFLAHPKVRQLFPEGELERISCLCLPAMNVGAPARPCADRVVMIGDAGSTRLFKDGIGAAYFMAKSAAKTAVMHGVGEKDFTEHYMPDYRSLILDNRFGSFLFWFTDLFRKFRFMTSAMLRVVEKESQVRNGQTGILNSILWDMFTGNERYREIFRRAVRPGLIVKMTGAVLWQLLGKKP